MPNFRALDINGGAQVGTQGGLRFHPKNVFVFPLFLEGGIKAKFYQGFLQAQHLTRNKAEAVNQQFEVRTRLL